MRRFVTLVVVFLFSIPFGISVTGCKHAIPVTYCNGGDSGPIVGQTISIKIANFLVGYDLNQGQIVSAPVASGTDCRGNFIASGAYIWSTNNPGILDVQPTTGRLCAGTWNRNTGPVPDYTTCTPNNGSGLAYLYAAVDGTTSDPYPVFIHPVITNVVLGTPSTNCATDPATNCSPAALYAASSSSTLPSCTVLSNGCCSTPVATTVTPYNFSCLSQAATAQLAVRVYAGAGSSQTNISCVAGHLDYQPQTSSVVTIDQNGVATAQQPGSTLISAVSRSASSSAGYFSTCPPVSIALSAPGTGSASPTNITIGQNTPQPLSIVAKDKNGVTINGISLTYNTTNPTAIQTTYGPGFVQSVFPGVGAITATCLPPLCNSAPVNAIGLNGNGTPITSNPVLVTTLGSNSSTLYMASTQSQYVVPLDFTIGTIGNPIRLPYLPNSMVASEDRATLYFGSSTELMTFTTFNNSVTHEDPTLSGNVISVSPDNTIVVVTDPIRKLIYLYSASGAGATGGVVLTTYGGVATSAQWSPDSQTVYITAGNQLIVHSTYTGWSQETLSTSPLSVAVTVPSVGAYLSGSTTTGISYCPSITVNNTTTPPTTTSALFPVADQSSAITERLAATNDGLHILGASVTGASLAPTLNDILVTIPSTTPCPPTVGPGYFNSTYVPHLLSGITATSITGVFATTNSTRVFVTYTGTGGVLPSYTPNATGTGAITNVTLLTNGSPAAATVAPVAGSMSIDDTTFYAGTSGDDLVHIINTSTLQDIGTVAPALLDVNGNKAVPNLLAAKPRATP